MKSKTAFKQFDIVQVDLEPTKGSEQRGIRPCLIIETNSLAGLGQTVLVAPFTTKRLEKIYPYEVCVEPAKGNGLKQTSKVKLNQIRVIDKTRISKSLGSIEKDLQTQVLHAIALIFDFNRYFAEE